LRNSEVPLLAQIVGIADVFDALTTERPYRCARPAAEAFEALRDEAAKGGAVVSSWMRLWAS
jgi:putative two-component system response regulator